MELAEAIREVMDSLAFPLLYWSLQFKSFHVPEYQPFKIEDHIGTEISHEVGFEVINQGLFPSSPSHSWSVYLLM